LYLTGETLFFRYRAQPDARFEVFKAVTTKNAVFWGVTPCGSCQNWCFGETYHLHHQDVSSSLILSALMMEAICSPETSVLIRATQYHIPEDGILQGILYSPIISLKSINRRGFMMEIRFVLSQV
jgi:hypothetical protein